MKHVFHWEFTAQLFAIRCWFHGIKTDFEYYRDNKYRLCIAVTTSEPDQWSGGIIRKGK